MLLYCFRRLSVEDQHISASHRSSVAVESLCLRDSHGSSGQVLWRARLPWHLLTPSMSFLLPQMPTESRLSPPHFWEHLILPNPENCPHVLLPILPALHLNPFPHKSSLFPQTHSYPRPGSSAKLCSSVIAQPWSHPWNAARVKFSQDPPGWSLLTCAARSRSCLCRGNTRWEPRSTQPWLQQDFPSAALGQQLFQMREKTVTEFYQLSLALWLFPHNKCSWLPNSWTPTEQHLGVNEDFSALDRTYNHIW